MPRPWQRLSNAGNKLVLCKKSKAQNGRTCKKFDRAKHSTAQKIQQFEGEITVARGINKVILVGNVGQDPEVRYTAGGAAIANVSIATSDTWKDKQTGQNQERTEWHRVVFFNRLAEIAGEYLKKGSKVYIEGRLQTRKWSDQQGVERYTTEIVAGEMQMLDGRGAGGGQGADGGYGGDAYGGYAPAPNPGFAPGPNPGYGPSAAPQPPQGHYPPAAAPAAYGQAPEAPGYRKPAAAPRQAPPAAPAPAMDAFDDDIPF